MHMKKYELAIKKKYDKTTIKIYLDRKKTTHNKRLASKIVADWELKVVVPGTEFIWIAFDWRTKSIFFLQSKAIHMNSVPGTTTFSSQSATILDASLLLCVVFFRSK